MDKISFNSEIGMKNFRVVDNTLIMTLFNNSKKLKY